MCSWDDLDNDFAQKRKLVARISNSMCRCLLIAWALGARGPAAAGCLEVHGEVRIDTKKVQDF